MSELPLVLKAHCQSDIVPFAAPVLAKVTLSSTLATPIWVNSRMSMGYADSLIRELYFSVYDAKTDQLIPTPETERPVVHRLPPERDDFRQLTEGEQVSVLVDVAIWHPFKSAARYKLVFTYDNQFDGSEFGFRALVGTIQADPIVVNIQ